VRLLVCGGAGFIGSTFVRLRLSEHGDEVTVLDKLTYAGRRENLHDVIEEIRFVHGAIEDPTAVADAIGDCDAIVNFAAETHVDRSIADPEGFIVTNMQGTHVLLEAARTRNLRYLQVSTDEVYGSIEEGAFTEESPLQPSSPYSATKTGADLLVASYFHTYGLQTLICRGSNNYGPYQYPEKLIPLMILNALAGDRRRAQRSQLALRRGLRSRYRSCSRPRRPRRGIQLRRSRRVREPRGRAPRARADRPRGVADRVRHRPARA
jgi:dTDP-glucose 4,6-dehydratase